MWTLCATCQPVTVEPLFNGLTRLDGGETLVTDVASACNGLVVRINSLLVPRQLSGGARGGTDSAGADTGGGRESTGATGDGAYGRGGAPARGVTIGRDGELQCSLEDPACCDVPPPPGERDAEAGAGAGADDFTCGQQRFWGKCDEPWLLEGGYCRYSCGRCDAAPPPLPGEASGDDGGAGGSDGDYEFAREVRQKGSWHRRERQERRARQKKKRQVRGKVKKLMRYVPTRD